jgi:hypothetical protein
MTGQEVQLDQLMAMGAKQWTAIIAVGCGYPGAETAENIAGKLSLDSRRRLRNCGSHRRVDWPTIRQLICGK